jgi:putative transposase
MGDFRRVRVPGATYFFTLVANRRAPIFSNPAARRALHRAMVWVRANHPYTLDGAVLLPDHIHLLITLPPADAAYPTRMMLLKKRFTEFARESGLVREGPLTKKAALRGEAGFWQRRYWEHTIRSDADYQNHLDYIMYNPVKHGLVSRVADWPHSSFHRLVLNGLYPLDWGGTKEMKEMASLRTGE